MAVKRSRRLRKKLHIGEFKELGFNVAFSFAEGTSIDKIDHVVDQLITDVIQPQELAFFGSGHLAWEGVVCLQQIGECNDTHRASVKAWLEKQGLKNIEISGLYDVWWDEPIK